MTEDEAKTKACFRAATFGGSQQLADGPGPHCIGSACMAWRSAEITRKIDGGGYTLSTYKTRTVGFCGLAGQPS